MTAIASKLITPKHERIKVKGKHLHLRFIQQTVWSTAGAFLGACMVTALYYWLTQVRYTLPWGDHHQIFYLKHAWDSLLPWQWWVNGRHDFRDCYEAAFATLFIRSIVASRKKWGPPVATWRVVTSPLLIFVSAFPVILLGIAVIDIAPWHGSIPHLIVQYQAVIIGVVAGQVVHRVYAPIGSTVQLFFVEEFMLANKGKGRRPMWPLPPVIRERHAWMKERGVEPNDHNKAARVIIPLMAVVLIWLAIYGGFVKFVIAKGHG